MNLLGMLLDKQGSPALQQLSKGFGLSEGDARNVLSEMVPALSRGMQNNVSKQGGLEDLLGALTDHFVHKIQHRNDDIDRQIPPSGRCRVGITGKHAVMIK